MGINSEMSTQCVLNCFHFVVLLSIAFHGINSSNLPTTVNMSSATSPMPPSIFNGTFQLHFTPESINDLIRGSNTTVSFNCTLKDRAGDKDPSAENHNTNNATYYAWVASGNTDIVQFIIPSAMVDKDPKREDTLKKDLKLPIHINGVNNFTIQAMHIGYVTVFVTIFGTSSFVMARSAQASHSMGQGDLRVAVVPRPKTADFVFDCSAAAVAILISFGIGCVTDTENLKRQLKYPVSLVIGFCCQFLLMPVVSIHSYIISLNYN